MIVDTVDRAPAYALGPLWQKLLPELAALLSRGANLAEGSYSLAGGIENGGAAATVQRNTLKSRSASCYEVHERMADIQLVLQGEEYLEVVPLGSGAGLNFTSTTQDRERDLTLFAEQPEGTRIRLVPGLFALLTPGEAHMPGIATGSYAGNTVKKLVVKIPALQLYAPSGTR